MGTIVSSGCISAGSNSPVVSGGTSDLTFPDVVGIDLEGQARALPATLEGQHNLVAIAFERDQQRLVDTWIVEADRLVERYGSLRFYEIPTISESNALFRLWVNNGMRSGIADPAARQRTVTLYVDRDQFTRALDIPDVSDIHVLLLDDAGRVLWRAAGAADHEKLAALSRVLEMTGRAF